MTDRELIDQIVARVDMLEEMVYGCTRSWSEEKVRTPFKIKEDQYLLLKKGSNTWMFRANCNSGKEGVLLSLRTKNKNEARLIRDKICATIGDKPGTLNPSELRRIAKPVIEDHHNYGEAF